MKTYSPSDVVLIIGGYPVVEWDKITLKPTVEISTMVRGIRGRNTRVVSQDSSCTVELECPPTSQAHALLRSTAAADQVTGGGGRLEVMLKDLQSRLLFQSREGYVVGIAEHSFGAEMSNSTWVIQCTQGFISESQESGDLLSKAKNLIKKFI